MKNSEPYISKLPTELILEIAFTLCASSQGDYAALLLVSRTIHDLCRLTCLPVVPIVLETPEKTAQFANYLATDRDIAPRVRRLWIIRDHCGILSKCTNLVALACDGHDLVPIISYGSFQHTQLTDLTIMGLWDFWVQFVRAKHARTFCGQLEKLWLLDHLFLHGINLEWLSSLKELIYWSIESREDREQFEGEVKLLKVLPELGRLRVLMRSPSRYVFSKLGRIGDRRLQVVSWGKRDEVTEWICQGLEMAISG